jgi:hypothetical protein
MRVRDSKRTRFQPARTGDRADTSRASGPRLKPQRGRDEDKGQESTNRLKIARPMTFADAGTPRSWFQRATKFGVDIIRPLP